jgi:hypothetical protein
VDDIRRAVESLSKVDWLRLRKAARICLAGTEYGDPLEFVNEAVCRTMSAANGESGRCWRTSVPFIAYMIQTMKGLASDSREGSPQRRTRHLDAMVTDDDSTEDVLGRLGHHHSDALTVAIEQEETRDHCERAKADTALIDTYFAEDNEVTFIIMGLKDDLSPAKIRELGEMTDTQYNTARRRLRRGIEKLFPGRR